MSKAQRFPYIQIDPSLGVASHNTLYFSSKKYKNLLKEIGNGIREQNLAQRNNNPIEACRHGLKVWNCIQELMKMLYAKSVFELDRSRAGIYDFLSWAGNFADELHNASLRDESFVSKQIDFCEHYVEMHSNMLGC